jgi:hypothetical protein
VEVEVGAKVEGVNNQRSVGTEVGASGPTSTAFCKYNRLSTSGKRRIPAGTAGEILPPPPEPTTIPYPMTAMIPPWNRRRYRIIRNDCALSPRCMANKPLASTPTRRVHPIGIRGSSLALRKYRGEGVTQESTFSHLPSPNHRNLLLHHASHFLVTFPQNVSLEEFSVTPSSRRSWSPMLSWAAESGEASFQHNPAHK